MLKEKNIEALSREDISSAQEYLNYMGKHHADLFSVEEERKYAIMKSEVSKKIKKLLSDSLNLHRFVQNYFFEKKNSLEEELLSLPVDDRSETKVKLNRCKQIIWDREKSFQEYNDLKDKTIIECRGEVNSNELSEKLQNFLNEVSEKYSNILLETIKSFNEWEEVINYLQSLEYYKHPQIKTDKDMINELYTAYKRIEEEFFNHNWRFVVTLAKNFAGRGLSFMELIQEGNKGLLKAFERYEPEKGTKFVTYANNWIFESIITAVYNTSKTISIPSDLTKIISKLKQEENNLIQENKCLVTPEEVILSFEEKNGKIKGYSLKTIIKALKSLKVESFEKEIEKEITLGEVLEAEQSSVQESAEQQLSSSKLGSCIRFLTDRDQKILELRYGLNGKPEKSCSDIAKMFGVDTEEIQFAETRLLRTLGEYWHAL